MRKLLTLLFVLFAINCVAPASAQVGQIPTYIQPPPSAIVSYISDNSSTTAGTSFTFTSQNIGTANANRIVAIAIAGNTAVSAVSSVTIAGVSATRATSAYASDSGSTNTDIWYAAVPTGTTGNIVVNWTVSEARCVIFVYNITASGAAFSSAKGSGVSVAASSASASLSVPSGGATIGVVSMHTTGLTFAGTNLTMDVNSLVVGSSTYGAGHDSSSSGSTSFGFSWGSNQNGAMSVATFSP